MSLLPGSRLGPYEILSPIGAGGMGEVYRAHDPRLGREVAVKVLPAAVASRPDRLARFEREARSVAALNHPNIVTLHSIEEAEGIRFLTMELVEGQTLDQLAVPGGLAVGRVLDLAIPLADALSAAHERGVIHRDLKPANVMLTREGRVKVLDFGLAKLDSAAPGGAVETMAADPHHTVEGQIFGTAAYMSPEQAEGKLTDARCDVFSFGVILYELATGVAPFQGGSTMATIASVLTHRPRPVTELRSDLPPALSAVVGKCMEKDPRQRYGTALELRQALEQMKAELSAGSTPGAAAPHPAASAPDAIEAAFARHDWQSTYSALHELRESRTLTARELEMLATAAIWLSKFEECVTTREKAFADYQKAGQNIPAARVALELVRDYINKNAASIAQGWRKRAERLLENEPDCVLRGYFHRLDAVAALEGGDFSRALDLARQSIEAADRFGDADLRTLAIHLQGRILVARGDAPAGTALIDEAMTGAASGEVSPFTLGVLYCNTMEVCETLGDFNRAREWNEAAGRWCGSDGTSPWPSICRIHGARTMRQQGRWAEAEKAARSACEALRSCGDDVGVGESLNEIGEIELLKGEYSAAEAAFQQAHELGVDPVPGLPLLRLAQGKTEAAARMLARALDETTNNRLRRASLLAARIAVDLAGAQLDSAAGAADELMSIAGTFGSAMYEAHARMGLGGVALARGDVAAAVPALREAWTLFRDSGFPYDAARARLLLGEAYEKSGNAEDARMQFEAARKCFADLGARADAEAVSARLGAGPGSA